MLWNHSLKKAEAGFCQNWVFSNDICYPERSGIHTTKLLKAKQKDGNCHGFFTPLGKNILFDQMKKPTVTLACCSLYSFLELGMS